MAEDIESAKTLLLDWVEDTEGWYSSEASWWISLLSLCKIASFVASVGSIALAVSLGSDAAPSPWHKWLIVAASVLGAASSNFLVQFKVREKEAMRENGRIKAEEIGKEVKQRIIQFGNDSGKIFSLMDETRKRLAELDREQHREDVKLHRDKPR